MSARFDRADLKEASLLGITVGATDERPRYEPADCTQTEVDNCIDFCDVYVSALELAQEQFPEVEILIPNCDDMSSQLGINISTSGNCSWASSNAET